jgi:hypothetical protein
MAMNNPKTQRTEPIIQMKINNTPAVPGTLIKKIDLENGQTLVLSDLSRDISEDACVVILQAAMEISVTPSLFDNVPPSGVTVDQIRDTLGEKVIYEYRMERNFILNHEKDGVLDSLVDTFLKNMGQYISHPRFAPKLVLKQYKARK